VRYCGSWCQVQGVFFFSHLVKLERQIDTINQQQACISRDRYLTIQKISSFMSSFYGTFDIEIKEENNKTSSWFSKLK